MDLKADLADHLAELGRGGRPARAEDDGSVDRLHPQPGPQGMLPWTPSIWSDVVLEVPFGRLPTGVSAARLIAATCLLMDTPAVAELSRVERTYRDGPGAPRLPAAVQVVALRELVRPRQATSPGEHPGQQHAYRWMVSGHWRQQPCGPGRSLRKPVWVTPHIKGPAGAPIKERVHVWRR